MQGQERRDGMSKGFTLAEKNGSIIGALNIDGELRLVMITVVEGGQLCYLNVNSSLQ